MTLQYPKIAPRLISQFDKPSGARAIHVQDPVSGRYFLINQITLETGEIESLVFPSGPDGTIGDYTEVAGERSTTAEEIFDMWCNGRLSFYGLPEPECL
jgi:hypothetical protein